MRNRSSTPVRDENDFINAGTAGIDQRRNQADDSEEKTRNIKAKPVSISFANENLLSIERHIKNEIMSGNARANRSDVVRAGVLALEQLTQSEVSQLIEKARLK